MHLNNIKRHKILLSAVLSIFIITSIVLYYAMTRQYIFTHERYGFSLAFDDKVDVQKIKEGKASETIIFTKKDEYAFQIFVTPYIEKIITASRFKKDVKSEDIRERQEIYIGDNIRALMFKSTALTLGEVREVWFIYDGFIYESTIQIKDEKILANILNTLRFRVSAD